MVTLTASLYNSGLEIVIEDRGVGINNLEQAIDPGQEQTQNSWGWVLFLCVPLWMSWR